MRHYSVTPRDQILKKSKKYFSLAKNTGKNIAKTLIKNLSSNYSQTFLDHAKQSATDVLETATKRAVKKASETTDDFIFRNLLIKLQKPRKLCSRIIQKQLQMSMIKRYLKKDIYISRRKTKNCDDLRSI